MRGIEMVVEFPIANANLPMPHCLLWRPQRSLRRPSGRAYCSCLRRHRLCFTRAASSRCARTSQRNPIGCRNHRRDHQRLSARNAV